MLYIAFFCCLRTWFNLYFFWGWEESEVLWSMNTLWISCVSVLDTFNYTKLCDLFKLLVVSVFMSYPVSVSCPMSVPKSVLHRWGAFQWLLLWFSDWEICLINKILLKIVVLAWILSNTIYKMIVELWWVKFINSLLTFQSFTWYSSKSWNVLAPSWLMLC